MSEQRDTNVGMFDRLKPLLEDLASLEWTADNGTSYRFTKRPGHRNYKLSRKILHRAQIIKAISQDWDKLSTFSDSTENAEDNQKGKGDFALKAVTTVTELFNEKFVDELEGELLDCVMYRRGGTNDAYNKLTNVVMDSALEGAEFTDMYIILARAFVVNFMGGLQNIGLFVDLL